VLVYFRVCSDAEHLSDAFRRHKIVQIMRGKAPDQAAQRAAREYRRQTVHCTFLTSAQRIIPATTTACSQARQSYFGATLTLVKAMRVCFGPDHIERSSRRSEM
jgi:hypothetical protein